MTDSPVAGQPVRILLRVRRFFCGNPECGRKTQASLPGISRFATGLTADLDAVTAGLSPPFSSGPVEGNVNRIKMIKRQMYGRAGFDLLRKRVLLT